ncbi:hypothetical protein [Microbacterium aurantiacum]|uniref:Uncharacterized protein n=1 Tax=Microbacterium aurantiacum TaxID=162393 RepID=A0AAJ2LV59_9MICO|nr:hypothetical protein [Microbacterium aurantiacum]MDS0244870.1 hypothetical protein [Microbacterium aurantiacum]
MLDIVANAPHAHALQRPLRMITGAAPRSPATIERLEELAGAPMRAYGLTEVYGPYTFIPSAVRHAG